MAKKAPPASIAQSWDRIKAWTKTNVPKRFKGLQKGATKAQVAGLEKKLGVTLPPPFVESLQIHTFQDGVASFIPDSFGSFYFLSGEELIGEWKVWNDVQATGDFDDRETQPDPGVMAGWWNRGWIPFAANGGGDNLCLDMTPTKKGRAGQIIEVRHDNAARKILAPDFAIWLGQLADSLECGELEDLDE